MEQWWEKAAREAKEKREYESKFPLIGEKVRRRGFGMEYGTIVVDRLNESEREEYFIKYDKKEDDYEQLIGLPFEIFKDGEWKNGYDYLPDKIY